MVDKTTKCLYNNDNTFNLFVKEELMKRLEKLHRGINVGNWLSQNGGLSVEEMEQRITEKDIDRIASWGLDHLRLPVDYFTFEQDTQPGVYDERALQIIDRCIEWCRARNLSVILDLHHAPGFTFVNGNAEIWDTGEKNDLFTNPEKQERFIAIWRMFAERYQTYGRELIFELMNELLAESTDPWNELWPKAVAAIREVDPDRTIVVGGNKNNECNELKNLVLLDDPGVVYTFHFYEPGFFTHQKAPFISYLKDYPLPVLYPFRREDHAAFFDAFDQMGMVPDVYRREVFDIDFIRDDMTPAKEFMEKTGKELFCGEFGMFGACDLQSSENWLRDVLQCFDELGVPCTIWNYLGFSHITKPGPEHEVESQRIIDILAGKA